MGDLNESLVALVMALIAAGSDGSDQSAAQAERDTGWQHFAMIASDIRVADPVPVCGDFPTESRLGSTFGPPAPANACHMEASADWHMR